MSVRIGNAWDALDGEWHYLGRNESAGFGIATLVPAAPFAKAGHRDSPAAPLAIAFTSLEAAADFAAAAPAGVELLTVAADDLRAKEEWLRALIEQGAATLVFDPGPDALESALASPTSIAVHTALGYILSHRRDTACL